MPWWKKISAAAGVAVLVSCGGGGGNNNPSNGGTTPQLVSMTLSPKQISVSASMSYQGPTAPLTINLSSAFSGQLYISYKSAHNTISNVIVASNTATSASLTVQFISPAALGVGTYSDTLWIGVYYDQAGSSPIGNSPQDVAVTYTITALPAPALTSMSPSSLLAGGAGFTITATGSHFTPSSILQWNGSPRTTTYVSATQLTAQITSNDIATPSTATVTISNGSAGGGTSNPLTFTIQAPVFSITSISPSSVLVGGPAFNLRVLGFQFAPSSVVQWNGSARHTTYVSPTELTAQIGAADITSKGTASITVLNPPDQGGTSNAVMLSIAAPDAVSFQINPAHSGAIEFSSVSLPTSKAWSATLEGPPSYALIT